MVKYNLNVVRKAAIVILATLAMKFAVSQPFITSFIPLKGPVGTSVTINGTGFSAVPSENIVFFGSVRASVTTANAGTLTVTVPAGSSFDYITVTRNNLTAYSQNPFVITFGNPALFDANTFAARINFATKTNPFGVRAIDLDGDGLPDLASTNRGDDTISVFRNISSPGSITFETRKDFLSGNAPYYIDYGDFDGDGKPDLVVANYSDNTISVFRNTSTIGTIMFDAKLDFTAGTNPQSVAVGDIDKDGKPDIAVGNGNAASVSLFRNLGSPGVISFAPKVDLALPGNPGSIALGDLNADGKPEVLSANPFNANFSLFRNTSTSGSFSFAARVNFAAGLSPQNIAIGDMDDAAMPDIAVSSNQTIYLYPNFMGVGGSINLGSPTILSMPGTQYVALGDLNGDGQIDLPSINFTFAELLLFRNASSPGSIDYENDFELSTGFAPADIITADIDLDGKPEMITANFGSHNLSVYRNRVNEPNIQTFRPVTGCAVAGTSVGLKGSLLTGATAVSFDGVPASSFTVHSDDSITAVVAGPFSSYVTVTTAAGTGRLNYPPPVISSFTPDTASPGSSIGIRGRYFCGATSVTIGGVTAASFTIYNDDSITAVVGGIGSGAVVVTTPHGSSSLTGFSNGPVISSFSPESGPAGTTVTISGRNFNPAPADNYVFFGAARAEVTAVSSNTLTVIAPPGTTYQPITVAAGGLLSYSGKPFKLTFSNPDTLALTSFEPKVDFASGLNPNDIAIADLDSDGRPDLISSNGGANNFSVFRNTSITGSITSGSFNSRTDFSTSQMPTSVATADMNGDAKPDVLLTRNFSTISIFLNNTSGATVSFAPRQDFSPVSQPKGLVAEDFDGDGKTDIIVCSDSSYYIHFMRNTSNGSTLSFHVSGIAAMDGISQNIFAADIDLDGKKDVVVIRKNLARVSVFRNTSIEGSISFAARIDIATPGIPGGVFAGDLDDDGRPDLVVTNNAVASISVFRNTSTVGTISFTGSTSYTTRLEPAGIFITDLDGNGQVDIAVANFNGDSISTFRNRSTPGNILFSPKVDFATGDGPLSLAIGDVDGDGKPDLVSANAVAASVSVLRNRSGEPMRMALCPGGNTSIISNLAGASYQWQENAGSGFINISNSANYTGTNTATLQLLNIPSAWYGFEYRCIVGGDTTITYSLKFQNNWTGAVNTAWENASNWSCGSVPDQNTDVVISTGTVLLNTNTTIRSLTLHAGASLTVAAAVILTITH